MWCWFLIIRAHWPWDIQIIGHCNDSAGGGGDDVEYECDIGEDGDDLQNEKKKKNSYNDSGFLV